MGRLRRWLQAIPAPTVPGKFVLPFLLLGFWFPLSIGDNALYFAACGVVATILLSAAATALASPEIGIERSMARRVFAGEPFPVSVTVRNRSRWRPGLGLAFRDALQSASPGEATCGGTVAVLPPGGGVRIGYEARIHRRGVYRISSFLSATRFPFGLFERRRLVEEATALTVLPSPGRLAREAKASLSRASRHAEARRAGRPGHEEFHALRPFLPGDNPRLIHWRTSARAGELMRREYRADAGAEWVVLLDAFPPEILRQEAKRVFERAISCCATLLVEASRDGRRARLLLPGRHPLDASGRGGLLRALEALAEIRFSGLRAEDLVAGLPAGGASTVLLLSLHGEAGEAKLLAARRGVDLLVWDVSSRRFDRIFQKS
jgi:uncharacterized protein (DUF58 family)